mgnify:CR=1 FL=1
MLDEKTFLRQRRLAQAVALALALVLPGGAAVGTSVNSG